MILGNVIGGMARTPQTIILVDDDGNELPAILLEGETEITATEDDIRKDTIAITNKGLTTGTKVIPSYHTAQGYKLVMVGNDAVISNLDTTVNIYDYTQLQAMICTFNSSVSNSVATEKVAIDNNVYNVQSEESLAQVTKNHDSKIVDLGISNNTQTTWLLRYFMYKEIK